MSLTSHAVGVQSCRSGHYISGRILVVASCQSQISFLCVIRHVLSIRAQSLKLLQFLGLHYPRFLTNFVSGIKG
jgi:hypothetical protein